MDDFYLSFIKAFNDAKVKYLVVGGFAVNFHGYNRTTGDLDLWVTNDGENLKQLGQAFESRGYEFPSEAAVELKNDRMLSLSEEGFTIEVMTRLNISTEVAFEEAFSKSDLRVVEGIQIPVISLQDLMDEKARSKRYKDLDDLAKLQEAQKFRDQGSKEK